MITHRNTRIDCCDDFTGNKVYCYEICIFKLTLKNSKRKCKKKNPGFVVKKKNRY